jgi:di/tricarboxylate transporter
VTTDQIILFALLLVVFVLLIWGRWRYDVVAFGALVVALIAGVVPTDRAFSGFGHPATVIIALVLIVSRGLSNSGAIELVARYVVDATRKLATHSLTLMPLSFASILGGMITLIGTPPNIIVSSFRNDALGAPYRMFDFAPVGLACSIGGVLFITLIGWRLIPKARREHDSTRELFELEEYIAEVRVPDGSAAVGKQVRELDDVAEDNETAIIGLVRRGQRMPGLARQVEIRENDVLVLEANPDAIEKLVGALGLSYVKAAKADRVFGGDDLSLAEAVVPDGARIAGRSAISLRLLARYGITLLGISRQGRRFRDRVRRRLIQPGDVLLLLGPSEQLPQVITWLGCLPLAERGLQVTQRRKAGLAVGIFAVAILVASVGVLDLPVALAGAAALLVLFGIVPLRQLYESVEWSVIVLLGSMIPIGWALEASGGTALIAQGIVGLSGDLPAPAVLALLIVVTMTLSDVMNNTATAVISAPIALDIANKLGVSPDPFLMGVAVAASCAFLTPIGHKNNTLIMGPGGYRFGDYWRMGLPLEVLIVIIATPTILMVWPL